MGAGGKPQGQQDNGKEERAAERAEFKRMWKSVMDLGTFVLGLCWGALNDASLTRRPHCPCPCIYVRMYHQARRS